MGRNFAAIWCFSLISHFIILRFRPATGWCRESQQRNPANGLNIPDFPSNRGLPAAASR
jgi:hypothetical protein